MLQMKLTFFTGHLCLVAKLGRVTYMYFSDLSRAERTKMAAKEEVESIQEIKINTVPLCKGGQLCIESHNSSTTGVKNYPRFTF